MPFRYRFLLAGLFLIACRGGNTNPGPDAGADADVEIDAAPPFPYTAVVTRIIDGDTMEVEYEGMDLTVRLFCVDTPELSPPPEPFADEARQFTLNNAAPGWQIGLEFDNPVCGFPPIASGCFDQFGRLLAYVRTPQDLDLNALLVANGLATVYTQANCGRETDYLTLQQQAQSQSLGIWGP